MSEDGEFSRQYRDAQQARRKERLPIRVKEIMELQNDGYEVKQITEYQFRVNDKIDLYPIHHRYHVLKNNKRGSYKVGQLTNDLAIIYFK